MPLQYRVVFTALDDEKITDEIEQYFHCTKCLNEHPEGTSPREYSRLEVGIRKDGALQVRCARHEINIVVIQISAEAVH